MKKEEKTAIQAIPNEEAAVKIELRGLGRFTSFYAYYLNSCFCSIASCSFLFIRCAYK